MLCPGCSTSTAESLAPHELLAMAADVPLGLLNINKPAGITSRAVVDQIVRLVRPARAGHAGTLDPMATGVLIVCVGAATRLIPIVQQLQKGYRAQFKLGWRSDTDDVTGEMSEVPTTGEVTASQIEAALPRFVGQIEQVPPQYSAVHVAGQRAYKRARRGERVEIKARTVEVYGIDLVSFSYPEVELAIECGSGTYVRSIGRDLGEMLGCGAVMSRLERTHIGPFDLAEAVDLQQLTADSLNDCLLPVSAATAHLPRYRCTSDELTDIVHGRRFDCRQPSGFDDGALVAVATAEDELACLANFRAQDGTLAPKQVFATHN